jgi:hypothetical protein
VEWGSLGLTGGGPSKCGRHSGLFLLFLDRVSGRPYDPHVCATSLCLRLIGWDLSMNKPRRRPRLLLPKLILPREA